MKTLDEKDITAISLPGRSFKVLVDPEKVGSQYLTFGISEIPEGSSLPWHVHQGTEEVIYVLQGIGSGQSDAETKAIHPGSVLYIEPNMNHRIVNEGKGGMKLLCAFSPPIKISAPK